MAQYEGQDQFPASAELVTDGTPRDAASVNVAIEAALDRTQYLKRRIIDGQDAVTVGDLNALGDADIDGDLDVGGAATVDGLLTSGNLNTGTVQALQVNSTAGVSAGGSVTSGVGFFVGSRTVVDVQQGVCIPVSGWALQIDPFDPSLFCWVTTSTSASKLLIPIDVPDLANITQVTARYTGQFTHPALPENMPTLTVYRRNITISGAPNAEWSATDPSGSVLQYEGFHNITVDIDPAHTVDRGTGRYYAVLTSESGANAIAGAIFLGLLVTYTYTRLDRA